MQNEVLRQMRHICLGAGGTVVTVNHIVESGHSVESALGGQWRDAIKTRIFLETTSAVGIQYAQLQTDDARAR